MSKWREYKLGEIIEITSSKRIFYSEYVSEGVPFYRSKEIIESYNHQDISTELYIPRARYEEIKQTYGVPRTGDILLTSVGTLGVPYLVKGVDEFYFKDGNLTWFRKVNPEIVDQRYLYFWITSKIGQQKLSEASIGSTQPALTIIGLKNIDILLPSLHEQRAIVSVVSSLDDKIGLLHRQNKTLESLASTLWRKMFVEDASSKWGNGRLSDIADVNPYRELRKGTLATYLDMSNMPTNSLFPQDWESREYSGGMKFKNTDTLIARITPCLENGKTAHINFLKDGEIAAGSTEYIVLSPKKTTSAEWLYFLARHNDFRDFAIQNMTGTSGRQRVSGETIAQYEIAIPPTKTIEDFHAFAAPIVNHVKQNSIQIRVLTKMRDGLLPKMMSGGIGGTMV